MGDAALQGVAPVVPASRQPPALSGGSDRRGPDRGRRAWLGAGLAAALAACASTPPPMRAPPPATVDPRARALFEAMQGRRLVLLGEVHDNAEQHGLRLLAFELLLASGARPALLLEMFDRERQTDLDRLRAYATLPGGGELLAVNAGGPGWTWSHYRPFLDRAIEAGLPIVAANVSRADARLVVADGLAAHGFDAAVPPDVEAVQAGLVQAAHCGAFDAATAARLARVQLARDQFMARRLAAQADRGALLLAGNGHVRRDVGIVRWLPPELARETVAIGLLEEGDPTPASAFDRVVVTAGAVRADPCAALRPVATPATPATPATEPGPAPSPTPAPTARRTTKPSRATGAPAGRPARSPRPTQTRPTPTTPAAPRPDPPAEPATR